MFSKENILFGKIFKEKFVFDSPTDRLSLIDLITSKFGENFYVFANTLSSLQDIT